MDLNWFQEIFMEIISRSILIVKSITRFDWFVQPYHQVDAWFITIVLFFLGKSQKESYPQSNHPGR